MQYYQENSLALKEYKKRCTSAQETRATETYTPKTQPSKFRQRIAIIHFFNQDSSSRKLGAKTQSENKAEAKKQSLKKQLETKKFQFNRKFALQKQRFSMIQKEHEEEMAQLSEKLRKSAKTPLVSKSTAFIRWQEKSKEKLEQLKFEEEQKSLLNLNISKEKVRHSEFLKEQHIRKISNSAGKLNLKVDKVHEKKVKTVDNNDEQYYDLIAKNKSINERKSRLTCDSQRKLEWRIMKSTEKRMRVEMNLNELSLEKERKNQELDRKHMKSEQNLREIKRKVEESIENKQHHYRMKAEKSFDRIKNQRKTQFDAKQEIIKKHMMMDHKIKIKNSTRENFNQQRRSKVLQESMDRELVKQLKMKISKSKDPLDISSLLSNF